jgi:hypothetical protein
MEPRHYSPIFGPAPDPHDYLWLSVSQPDGLYAAQGNGEPISSAEALYLAVLIVAFGLLIAVLAFAAVVA